MIPMLNRNIDGPGRSLDRRGVKAMQRVSDRDERKAAAQVKRDQRRAKRAGGPNVIVLSKYPKATVTKATPDGAYIWDGGRPEGGFWQIIVVGPLRGPVDAYRAAAAAWLKKPLVLRSAKVMSPCDPMDAGVVADRGFLDLILELDDGAERVVETAYAPPGKWPNHELEQAIVNDRRFRSRGAGEA